MSAEPLQDNENVSTTTLRIRTGSVGGGGGFRGGRWKTHDDDEGLLANTSRDGGFPPGQDGSLDSPVMMLR